MKLLDTAVVLAGGKSRRMGFDKTNIKLGKKTLLELIALRLEKHFSQIILATAKHNSGIKIENVKVVIDEYENLGPVAGLHAGLKEAESRYVYLTACDMPFISDRLVFHMKQILETEPEIVACSRKGFIEPFHAVYRKDLVEKIEKQIKTGNCSIYKLMKSSRLHLIKQPRLDQLCGNIPLWTNINTVLDLELFQKRGRINGRKNIQNGLS